MRVLWLVPALALTLTACGADPVGERRADVEAVTFAANAGDAAGLRAAIEDLRSTIRGQVASGELDRAEGERLNAIALRLLENAALLEQPSAPPTPEQEPTPEPEPTPEQEEPSPEPSPTPEEEEPEPEPSPEEPEPEPEPSEVELPPVEESPPTANAQTPPSSEPSPA